MTWRPAHRHIQSGAYAPRRTHFVKLECGREGGPIGVMLYEHNLTRRHTKEMADALGALDAGDKNAERRFNVAAHEYIELLTNHIHKEDNVLFDMGDRVMSDDDQTALCKRFCEVGCRPSMAKSARSWYR